MLIINNKTNYKKTFGLLAAVAVVVAAGCSYQQNKQSEGLTELADKGNKGGYVKGKTIHLSLENPKEVDLKDLFSSITITPLEISDNSVIGRLFKGKNTIVVPNKYYIVFDKYYTIYLFDMQGKFISNSKQCIGDGPKTYQILQDVAYNPYTNTIDVLDAKNVIYQYDINFKYVNKYKIKHKSKQI